MATFGQAYVHFIWSTWGRAPLITADVADRLYAIMAERCRHLDCLPLAIGGVEDHVHLLVGFPATLTFAQLAREVKGASSYLMNTSIRPGDQFRWQKGYGFFTLSKRSVPQVQEYIRHQAAHHANRTTLPDLENSGDDID